MPLIGARLGDGIHYATRCLAELGAVVAVADLEFLDGIGAINVADDDGAAARFREKGLRVVRAVYGIAVVETGKAAEAAEAAVAISGDGRSE